MRVRSLSPRELFQAIIDASYSICACSVCMRCVIARSTCGREEGRRGARPDNKRQRVVKSKQEQCNACVCACVSHVADCTTLYLCGSTGVAKDRDNKGTPNSEQNIHI